MATFRPASPQSSPTSGRSATIGLLWAAHCGHWRAPVLREFVIGEPASRARPAHALLVPPARADAPALRLCVLPKCSRGRLWSTFGKFKFNQSIGSRGANSKRRARARLTDERPLRISARSGGRWHCVAQARPAPALLQAHHGPEYARAARAPARSLLPAGRPASQPTRLALVKRANLPPASTPQPCARKRPDARPRSRIGPPRRAASAAAAAKLAATADGRLELSRAAAMRSLCRGHSAPVSCNRRASFPFEIRAHSSASQPAGHTSLPPPPPPGRSTCEYSQSRSRSCSPLRSSWRSRLVPVLAIVATEPAGWPWRARKPDRAWRLLKPPARPADHHLVRAG